MKNRLIITKNTDPWLNLAAEQNFVLPAASSMLFLWQNAKTVVIGKNQNAHAECRAVLLEEEGGKLARRPSGGGAVFHDMGNLCFSFIVPEKVYCLKRQTGVIINALAKFGINAGFSGRNDMTADGAKFSGSAYYKNGTHMIHHGTLLVSADFEMMSRYLTPPEIKLTSKSISSVRSRVINLSSLNPSLTIPDMQNVLAEMFEKEYGETEKCADTVLRDNPELEKAYSQFSSWSFRYGNSIPAEAVLSHKFDWGYFELRLSVKNGLITDAQINTDALEADAFVLLPERLRGIRFTASDIAEAAGCAGIYDRDITCWLLSSQL